MKLKLKRIAPMQAGKMLGALYGLISLIFVPFFLLFMAISSFAASTQQGAQFAVPVMMGMGVGLMILMPLIYAAMGFIGGVVGAAVYNLLGKWIGGFELDFEAVEPPKA